MSSDFDRVFVTDDRLGAITDKIRYAVVQGAQNCTSASFPATAQSTSQLQFTVPVPSLETIVDRRVLISSKVTISVSIGASARGEDPAQSGISGNQFLVNYGVTDALSPFPLHACMATSSVVINNNRITTNTSDVLPIMLRTLDPEELAKYEGYRPTTLDYLANYRDGVDKMEYILGASAGAGDAARPIVYLPGNAEAEPTGSNVKGVRTQKL
jgi:hypothetical protein